MKAERKGFTLVEMLVAMAVLAIVLGEIGVVLSNTTKIYSKGSYEIFLQSEAQQAVQSMEELMVDATKEIKKVGDNIVVTNNVVGGTSSYTFSLVQDRTDRPYKTLYVSKDGGDPFPVAEYVKSMDLITTSYDKNSMVTLKLEMEGEGGYQYNVTKDIYNRNEIGTGTTDPDDLDPGTGAKDLNVLRFHNYKLQAELPAGKTWNHFEFIDDANARLYYEIVVVDGAYVLRANDHLNNYEDPVGEFDLKCTAAEGGDPYTISVYSEKCEIPGSFHLLNAHIDQSALCRSYFPIKGYSASDITNCKIDWYMGNILLTSATLSLGESTPIEKRKFPSESNKLYESQFDGDGLTLDSEFKGNNLVLALNRMTNPGDDPCKYYAKMVHDYEMTQWVNCTITWPNGNTKSFKAFLYPVGDGGCIFDDAQKTVFWDVVENKGGGTNSSWTQIRDYVIDDTPPDWDVISGSLSVNNYGTQIQFGGNGPATIKFSKRVHLSCDNGQATVVGENTYKIENPDPYNSYVGGRVTW